MAMNQIEARIRRLERILSELRRCKCHPEQARGIYNDLHRWALDYAITCVDDYVDGAHGSGWELWKDTLKARLKSHFGYDQP